MNDSWPESRGGGRRQLTFVQVGLHVQTVQREGDVGVNLGREELVPEPLEVYAQHLNTT